jgi:hypothetical protein
MDEELFRSATRTNLLVWFENRTGLDIGHQQDYDGLRLLLLVRG